MGRVDWEKWRANNPAPKEWVRRPCSRCGAATVKEASEKCRPVQMPCGEYECGTPEEAPTYFGYMHGRSQDWLAREGDFWSHVAYDEGLTDSMDGINPNNLREASE